VVPLSLLLSSIETPALTGKGTMSEYSLNASVRPPAVAGLFYPGDAEALREMLGRLLANAHVETQLPFPPKALIVPHAGYPYSGQVAAAAYNLVESLCAVIKRVVLIGPSHRVYLHGIALPRTQSFATPLGVIPIDEEGRHRLLQRGDVIASDAPHELEHCLEVQLPFLQTLLHDFSLLPLVVGSTSVPHVAAVLQDVWGDAETLVVASSDLSHYLPYGPAKEVDAVTASAIVNRHTDITHQQACGAAGVNGLLAIAQRLGLDVTEIARLNSGDTSGDVRRVVGYGAFAIHEPRKRTPQ
jgi:MEMO1 family protein